MSANDDMVSELVGHLKTHAHAAFNWRQSRCAAVRCVRDIGLRAPVSFERYIGQRDRCWKKAAVPRSRILLRGING
jgi:hypothetical protein